MKKISINLSNFELVDVDITVTNTGEKEVKGYTLSSTMVKNERFDHSWNANFDGKKNNLSATLPAKQWNATLSLDGRP